MESYLASPASSVLVRCPRPPSFQNSTQVTQLTLLLSVLGGALTTNMTWRWCFYINLPVGGVTMIVLFFILKAPPPKNTNLTFKEQVAQLDILGTSIFALCMVCL